MFISQAYAQAAAPAGGAAGLEQFLPFVLIVVVFYFLLLRPQQKRAKAHKEMVTALRRGDKVITQAGIYGTVSKVIDEVSVQVEIAYNVKIKLARSAIGEVLAKTEPVKDAGGKDEPATDAVVEGEAAPAEKPTNLLGKLFGKK
jgi:preprotein translocase subunit YajC